MKHEFIEAIEKSMKSRLIKDPKLPVEQKGFDPSLKTTTETTVMIQVKNKLGRWTDGYKPSPDFLEILKERGQEYRYIEQSVIIERRLIEAPK